MPIETVTPRQAAAVGLLALVPALWYGIGLSLTAGLVAGVNVLIVVAALYVAFEPVDGGHGHGTNGSAA